MIPTNTYPRRKKAPVYISQDRSTEDCLKLDGTEERIGDVAYKRVTKTEAADLYSKRRTIYVNIVPQVRTWWKPLAFNIFKIRDEFPGNNFNDVVSTKPGSLLRSRFPRWKDEFYFFVKIPIEAKRSPRYANAI